MAALHISISAEPLFQIAGFTVTNSIATGTVISFLLILFAILFKGSKKQTLMPQGRLHNLIEFVIEALYNLTTDIAGQTKARFFFPFIATSFIFILFNNWVSVIPGVGTIGKLENSAEDSHASQSLVSSAHAAETQLDTSASTTEATQLAQESPDHSQPTFIPYIRPATADINTTLALALISVGLTQYYGFKYLGLGYLKKFFNFSNPITTFVGVLEIVSEFAKIISFAFRLFGNIFAGEVLLAVTAFLIPLFAPIPFLGLEIFVGLIQALVFAMLTLVFINMATISHDEH